METIKLNEDQIKELESFWKQIEQIKRDIKKDYLLLKQSHNRLKNKIQTMFPNKDETEWSLIWSSKEIIFKEKEGEFSKV